MTPQDALTLPEPDPSEVDRGGMPTGWIRASLADVTAGVTKVDPRKGGRGFNYIDLSALQAGSITKVQRLKAADAPSRARQLVRAGDVLFSGVRVYLKNVALVGADYEGAVASTAFCVLRSNGAADPSYLFHLVNWQKFINLLLPLQRGNSPPAVLDNDIKAQRLPLPPLAEQRRIVARIDELFVEIAEGEAALDRTREGLDTWRRALLKAAVTGELTRDWRETHRPTETGAELLARIRAGRLSQASKAGRRARRPAPTGGSEDIGDLGSNFPPGWQWTRLGEIISDALIGLDRNSAAQRAGPNGVAYLKMNNISFDGRVDTDALVQISANSSEISRYSLRNGDVLFNTRNSRELVGKTGIVTRLSRRAVFNNNILRIRFHEGISPEFVCLQICSPPFRRRLEAIKRATTSVAAVYQGDLLELPIAIPPTYEQAEVVSRARDQVDEWAHALAVVESTRTVDAAALRQSVLKAAFEGRLVPQDPADEPASVLLARLRAGNSKATLGPRFRGDGANGGNTNP